MGRFHVEKRSLTEADRAIRRMAKDWTLLPLADMADILTIVQSLQGRKRDYTGHDDAEERRYD